MTRSLPFPGTGAAPVSPSATGVRALGVPVTTTRVVSPARSVTVVPPTDAAVPAGTTLTWCWPNESAIGLDGTPYATLVRRVCPSTTMSTDPTAATPDTTCRRPSVLPGVSGPEALLEQAAAASK